MRRMLAVATLVVSLGAAGLAAPGPASAAGDVMRSGEPGGDL